MKRHNPDFEPFPLEENKKTVKKIKKKDLTILAALDQIIEASRDKQIDLECLAPVKTSVDFVTEKLGLTPLQVMLYTPIVNLSPRSVSLRQLADFFECSNLHVMRYSKEFDALVEKKLLRSINGKEEFVVPKKVVEAFKNNEIYQADEYKDYTTQQLFDICDDLFQEVSDENMEWEDYVTEIRFVLDANPHLLFAQKIQEYHLTNTELFILMTFCMYYVYANRTELAPSRFRFMTRVEYARQEKALALGKHQLQKLNLVENVNENGMANAALYKLTNHAISELLSEVERKEDKSKNKQLTYANTIAEKMMYYNSEEEKQIHQLANLLENEHFADVQKRLKENGMRTGFACLFYGAPGTGKTETVLQLARKTGRNIMQINISEVKSKWVGESEKNIKEIFDRYRSLVKREKIAPILFFNEADAIFGTRMENTDSAVDKMENSIQNIILQEMETLNGILIATTNLSGNLDKAFERRFLYKVKFQKPGNESQKLIWKSMIPDLEEEALTKLSTKYDFSGGQIENIARKKIIKNIIDGEQVTLEQLEEFCDAEKLDKNDRKKVGFGAN